jgi:hypothetical protein
VILDPSVLIAAEPQLHGKLREWKLFFVFPMTLLSGFPPTAVMYPVGLSRPWLFRGTAIRL